MILEGSIRIPFTYAAGEVTSRFLVALRDRRVILAGICSLCARVVCPPRSFCAGCSGAITDVVEVGPGGVVEAWTETPENGTFGMIRLDGAETPLVHRLIGPNQWAPGVRVIARFADERIASISDIAGFEAEEGAL